MTAASRPRRESLTDPATRLIVMPPTPPVRLTAAELNARIRAFWTDGRGHPAVGLTDKQRAEYQELLAQLERVKRGDVVEAA